MKEFKNFQFNCQNCDNIITIPDLNDLFVSSGSTERSMGYEVLYTFNSKDNVVLNCQHCNVNYDLEVSIEQYPEGVFNVLHTNQTLSEVAEPYEND
ncbi:hypothetical protein [Anaerocolumna xylanovorans]|uniref:Uncharacterized protein n=1 Tax=Anaerocolumna xylanovorans DSM 12503 TaxID=1121345 RepID=A0A1M7Y8G9_9FIRM|nr:hypothetical protein [Anaerocolumna xylanovorans]SHO48932.1 hypothetical protein SAMN02745217_02102 [Anaerocolumna xylanovorans DSM 12503]